MNPNAERAQEKAMRFVRLVNTPGELLYWSFELTKVQTVINLAGLQSNSQQIGQILTPGQRSKWQELQEERCGERGRPGLARPPGDEATASFSGNDCDLQRRCLPNDTPA
jgi:hypothetical protein